MSNRLTCSRAAIVLLAMVMSGCVLVQVLMVSLHTDLNFHPDEAAHASASAYFKDLWFKKSDDAPEMMGAIIDGWGGSYLQLNDVVYFLAEKTTQLLDVWIEEDFKRYRMFNVVLLAVLFLLFVANLGNGFYFLFALGLTPQLFYVFAYFNGDAFSLFVAMLLGLWFVSRHERIRNAFWLGASDRGALVGLALLSSLLLFTRLHYAIVLPFILGIILLNKPDGLGLAHGRRALGRVVLFAAIVLVPAAAVALKAQVVNGLERAERIAAVKAQNADPAFTLEGIRETRSNPYLLYLRDLGVPLGDLLSRQPTSSGDFDQPRPVRYDWLGRSAQWTFGVYGYGAYMTPTWFAAGSALLGLVAVAVVMLWNGWKCCWRYRLMIIYLGLGVFAVLAQSLAFSWLQGFQPQGRYLFAIIPMLAIVLALGAQQVPANIRYLLLVLLFLVNGVGFGLFGVTPMIA